MREKLTNESKDLNKYHKNYAFLKTFPCFKLVIKFLFPIPVVFCLSPNYFGFIDNTFG